MEQFQITGSMLYDFIQCPHRVSMDAFEESSHRDPISPFVNLLWERGTAFEKEVMGSLQKTYLDLSNHTPHDCLRLTSEAMERCEPLIYGGRIACEDLLGAPDLLRWDGAGYIAGDIKSGAGDEGGSEDDVEDGKPKIHYAVQLALYTDILERIGKAASRHAFVWDIHGREVRYDFDALFGIRAPITLWKKYQDALAGVRAALSKEKKTLPAYSSVCKNCVWYSFCLDTLEKADDLTLLPLLGRSKRDILIEHIPSVKEFAAVDPNVFIRGKKTVFSGMGSETLRQFHARAKLRSDSKSKAYLSAPVVLPSSDHELFFDIEVDPMRGVCYLHGFLERKAGDAGAERFIYFFADGVNDEKHAFAGAWEFLRGADAAALYYYSKYERTIYRGLQEKYPDVCSREEVEALFNPQKSVDLYYDVVRKATEWPTRDYSLKTLAKHLGFAWRDTHPSGAASIEWFHRWVETGDIEIRQRILDYNEDDCRATRVLLDGIRGLARDA
jgi:predicted RecB family nuclease